jgi:hypothetical protein
MSLICSYPVMQIRPYGLLMYEQREYDTIQRHSRNTLGEGFKSYTGELTPYAKKKLKRAIQLMVAIAKDKEATHFKSGKSFKFKLNFITLTLPAAQGETTDKEIKVCLDNWIKRAKRKYQLKSYVWRAERQANGNLHFHMITDTYIRYDHIRNDWNSVLYPTGLIAKYQQKHGLKQPNSTDVHAISRIRNLSSYFIKYMSKGRKQDEKPIEGKVWDCSTNLKTKTNCILFPDQVDLDCWNKIFSDNTVQRKSDEIVTILFIDPKQFSRYFRPEWLTKWQTYLEDIRMAA